MEPGDVVRAVDPKTGEWIEVRMGLAGGNPTNAHGARVTVRSQYAIKVLPHVGNVVEIDVEG
jgi:hypothetical protein